jgi:hypothetical protein
MPLGRNHIASTPITAIAMLCFNYTVGLPWSVPVLSRLLSVSRREPPESGRKPLRSTAILQANSGQPRAATPKGSSPQPPAPTARPTASHNSPTNPILRANPFPEVTDPVCRLPLPTLFYKPEAMHLGDLLRISVRPATKFTEPRTDFQGPTTAHRTPQEPQCFTDTPSLSPAKPIPGNTCPNKEEITLPGTVANVSMLGCVTALTPCGVHPRGQVQES